LIDNNTFFSQAITRDRELEIQIKIEKLDIVSDNKRLINNYKISNIFKGKFFIKRLIKKIFKYQLEQECIWKNNFWDNICIYKAQISFMHDMDKTSLKNYIEKNTDLNRLKDIDKYQKYLMRGNTLDPPLYITNGCLSYLGGKGDLDKIFILDGSRRLVANLLSDLSPHIFIMELSSEN